MSHISRLGHLKEAVGNVDAILITSPPNIFYLSGFTSSDAKLLITEGKQFLLTDSRYTIQAKSECPDFTVYDQNNALRDLCKDFSIKTLAFEGSISVNTYESLKSTLGNITFINCSKKIASLRWIKSDEEIEKIQTAAKICDDAFANLLNHIKVGVTEKELALALEFHIRKNGASDVSFDTIVAAGARSAMPHAVPTDTPIKNGDFLLFDFGALYDGYCSDITRTVIVGTPTDEKLAIYETVLAAQLSALSAIKSGKKCSDIDKVARDVISKAGFGKNFGHALGHSVGVEIHEMPTFSTACKEILKNNMVLTVEPGIYIENLGGVRIEDTVVIMEKNPKILTKTCKKLINL